jgi:hypothetical protein
LQTLIYALYIWEVAQTAVLTFDWYKIFALNFGNVSALSKIGAAWLSIPVMNSVCA